MGDFRAGPLSGSVGEEPGDENRDRINGLSQNIYTLLTYSKDGCDKMRRYRIEVLRGGKWFTVTRYAYSSLDAAKRGAEALGLTEYRIFDYAKWNMNDTKEDAVVYNTMLLSPEWRLTELDR